MIQRIQTLYLGIAIILLSIVTIGTELFSFLDETTRYAFGSWGITEYSIADGSVTGSQTFPFFVGTIALTLLAFLTIMSYKNLDRQHKLGRTVFYLYLLMVVGVILLSTFGDSMIDAETNKRELGLGFFLFICGFPFTFLANVGIKRDKNLLDSLDRLR